MVYRFISIPQLVRIAAACKVRLPGFGLGVPEDGQSIVYHHVVPHKILQHSALQRHRTTVIRVVSSKESRAAKHTFMNLQTYRPLDLNASARQNVCSSRSDRVATTLSAPLNNTSWNQTPDAVDHSASTVNTHSKTNNLPSSLG